MLRLRVRKFFIKNGKAGNGLGHAWGIGVGAFPASSHDLSFSDGCAIQRASVLQVLTSCFAMDGTYRREE